MRIACLLIVAASLFTACGPSDCRSARCGSGCIDSSGRYDSAGRAAPQASGTCGSSSCSAGCACSMNSQNQAQCLCTGAIPPTGYSCVEAPNCGSITCSAGCTCTDAASSACTCP